VRPLLRADRVAARDAVLADHKEQLTMAHADLERALTDSLALSKDLNESQSELTKERASNTLLTASRVGTSVVAALATCVCNCVATPWYTGEIGGA